MNVVTIIQARMGSSRLPGKSLRVLAGRPMIAHVLERAQAIGYPIVLATSVSERDSLLAEYAAMFCHVHRGSEWDVLTRMAEASSLYGAEVVVRLTGDCPLLAPDIARRVVELYARSGGTFASNDTTTSGWPDGMDVEVFSVEALHEAARRALMRSDREHVTPWLRRAKAHNVLPCDEDWSGMKLSVDSGEDLERVRTVSRYIPRGSYDWAATRDALSQHRGEGA